MKKKYKVISHRGLLSDVRREKIGTLKELAEEFRIYLGEEVPRKPESLEKRLNDSQRGKEHQYTYKTFFVQEVDE